MTAIGKIFQKPLIEATASDIARVCRAAIKSSGKTVLDRDVFTSGKTLIQDAQPVFKKDGKLSVFGKRKLAHMMEKLKLPINSKISEVIDALKKKGINFWEI